MRGGSGEGGGDDREMPQSAKSRRRSKKETHVNITSPSLPPSLPTCRACARGDPPPQGMVSRRFLAMAMDRVGGRRTWTREGGREGGR